jgi:hypothetical protein
LFVVARDRRSEPAQGIPQPTEGSNAPEGDRATSVHADAVEEGPQVVDVSEGVVQPGAVRPHGVHQADDRRLGG